MYAWGKFKEGITKEVRTRPLKQCFLQDIGCYSIRKGIYRKIILTSRSKEDQEENWHGELNYKETRVT